ncbi:hypothetical protein [PinkBerry-associated phage LS06-2018-MD08]|nr:hypothetical protein [PinkBerry-associated phage LS06-2018-MD08]
MRIVSQNMIHDLPYDSIALSIDTSNGGNYTICWEDKLLLGKYSSKEKALKVMQMIRNAKNGYIIPSATINYQVIVRERKIEPQQYFYMPQDNEVTL